MRSRIFFPFLVLRLRHLLSIQHICLRHLQTISYDEARDFITQRCFDWLREMDQLRVEMEAGHVFQGMREAVIMFPPTCKFERHGPGLTALGYDYGEKKCIPAWCDRILHRDSRSTPESECSLECPVVSSVLQYEACVDVTDSNHKPELGEVIFANQEAKSSLKHLWKVRPAAGIIEPDHTAEISVHREMFHTAAEFVDGFSSNWLREGNREEEVELVVKVSGSYMTETVNHRVRVCHCSSKEEQSNLTSNDSYQSQLNVLHRSDIQRLSNSYDMYEQPSGGKQKGMDKYFLSR